jgi:hypothetical protein
MQEISNFKENSHTEISDFESFEANSREPAFTMRKSHRNYRKMRFRCKFRLPESSSPSIRVQILFMAIEQPDESAWTESRTLLAVTLCHTQQPTFDTIHSDWDRCDRAYRIEKPPDHIQFGLIDYHRCFRRWLCFRSRAEGSTYL